MFGSSDDGGSGRMPDLEQLASTAKMFGKAAVAPAIQNMLRKQVVKLLQSHDPEKLEEFILTQYPLVQEELPQQYKNVLANVGPQFDDTIQNIVRPENVMYWLKEPKEWMEDGTDIEHLRQVRECHDIIQETPGGELWLQNQCLDVWKMAGVV